MCRVLFSLIVGLAAAGVYGFAPFPAAQPNIQATHSAGPVFTAFSASQAGSNAINTHSIRNICPLTNGGIQVRVTFKAGSGGNYALNNASIGISNGTESQTVATPVELKFSDASGFTISASATITSDWANLATSAGQNAVVVEDNAAISLDSQATPGGAAGRYYFLATGTYNSADPGAAAGNDGIVDSVLTIEVR